MNIVIKNNTLFIDHINKNDLEKLVNELKKKGLDFQVKIVFCG